MTTAQIAMDISDATGLPLSDVIETMDFGEFNATPASIGNMDANAMRWDTVEELEHCPDADDFSYMDDAVGFTPDLIRAEDITGHTAEEYRRDAFHGVSYVGHDDDEQEATP